MKNKSYRLHPASLFFLLTLGVVFVVWVLDIYGVSVYNPQDRSFLRVQSLLNAEGARWLMRHAIKNFLGFEPLGMVVVSLMGLGLARHSGFLEAAAQLFPSSKQTPHWALLLFILLGILSNVIGDAGYVFLIPLVAILAPGLGLHPVAAILITFVSVACGYSANWMLSSMDPLLARLSKEVSAGFLPQNFNSGKYANYYFMSASTFVLTAVIYAVSRWQLIPRLQRLGLRPAAVAAKKLSHREQRSLQVAGALGLAILVLVGWLTFSSWGLFRGVSGELVRSPFIMGALFILSLSFGLMGLVYGWSSGRYDSDWDVVRGLGSGIRELSVYFVVAFFAAQFFACIEYTQLDQFIVLLLGHFTRALNTESSLLLLCVFMLYAAVANLFMVSAVGKWSLISALFLPLFWEQGVSPDVVQAAYRIGDSSTNVITPFLYYCPFVLVLLEKLLPRVSFGFIARHTWRFSLAVFVAWSAFFLIWYLLGLPFGL